jgi:hypothetical protein
MSTTSINGSTTPANGQTRVAIQQVTANQVNITVNGVKYRISVFNSTNDAPISIGNKYNWEEIATQATQIALNLIGKPKFEKANLILAGIPENIETLSPAARTVTFIKAEIEETKGSRVEFEGSQISPELKAKITSNIETIGQTFAKAKPVSSKPNGPGSKQRQPEFIDVVIDPKAELCKGRPKTQAGVLDALATQLRDMPVGSKYHNQAVHVIKKKLRDEYTAHIMKNEEIYIKGDKFDAIFNALKRASTYHRTKLTTITTSLISTMPFKGKIKSNFQQIETALAEQAANLSDERKKELIRIYIAYVQDEYSVVIAEDSFLKIFADISAKGHNPDMFQVVITEESNDAQASLNSKHYPEKDKTIFTQRCAFIHLAKDGTYHSYDRTAQTVGSSSLADLNDLLQVDAARKIEKKPKPSAIPKITVDASGRCLDMSIAYQILFQINPKLKPDDLSIEGLADYLRTEAAVQINDDNRDKDVEFFNSLYSSIMEIPAFSTNPIYSNKQKEASLKSVKALLDDSKIAEIKQILEKKDYASLKSKEKKLLRTFYSQYITQKASDGKMNNYLDSAFLYVLPFINLQTHNNALHGNYEYAVLQGDYLDAKYPQNTELQKQNTIFVLYNGVNHYDAVNMQTASLQIDILIKEKQRELLDNLIDRANTSSAEATKQYLLGTIQYQHPKAYDQLKGLMYHYDTTVWEMKGKIDDAPGTIEMHYDGKAYHKSDYGNYRLHSIDPQELKELLSHDMGQTLLNDSSLK